MMLPDNLIVFAVLEAVTGYVWVTALCYVLWACTDMDLSWHKVRRLAAELEAALKETREARDRAETQIRFLAGQNQCLQVCYLKKEQGEIMINFEKLPSGDLRNTGAEYVLITPGLERSIDVDGSFTIAEFEQILETAKAASLSEQPQSAVAANPTIPGFVSLG